MANKKTVSKATSSLKKAMPTFVGMLGVMVVLGAGYKHGTQAVRDVVDFLTNPFKS